MALVKKTKNAWGKQRALGMPYATVHADGWTWKILKAYQSYQHESRNEYGRWMCAVSSPYTQGSWDMGDVYIRDIPMTPDLEAAINERIRLEEKMEAEQ